MEAFVIIPLLVALAVWIWFALTMNGIFNQLKKLNEKAAKQIDFLDYISDQIASISGKDKDKQR